MINLSIHDVTAIEIVSAFPSNSNSRCIRITSKDFTGVESTVELTVYGDTDVLDALPKAADFRRHGSVPLELNEVA